MRDGEKRQVFEREVLFVVVYSRWWEVPSYTVSNLRSFRTFYHLPSWQTVRDSAITQQHESPTSSALPPSYETYATPR